jgi:hypothetical protein
MRSNTYYHNLSRVPDKQNPAREKLEEQIKQYLAAGKQIQQIPKGYSKFSEQPMRSWIEESR